MLIKHLTVKNFRCFSQLDLDFDAPVTVLQGTNGAGKSSVLEVLHYLCYMRSFRTFAAGDMITFGKDNFFAKISFRVPGKNESQDLNYELQVGFSPEKRVVKLNQKAISSFKELMDFYRIITLTEDDLLALERKHFMHLLKHPDTLARMEHMLTTGKPLRN